MIRLLSPLTINERQDLEKVSSTKLRSEDIWFGFRLYFVKSFVKIQDQSVNLND